MLLSTLVMMLTKDTGPSEIPGQQAGVNKDTSEWPGQHGQRQHRLVQLGRRHRLGELRELGHMG